MDLVDVMDKTVKILKQEKKLEQFDNRGQRSCDDDPFRPWEFDKNVLRFLKRVYKNTKNLNDVFELCKFAELYLWFIEWILEPGE